MIFMDMDGVLATLGPLSDFEGTPPAYAEPNIHYFKKRPVDENAFALLVELDRIFPNRRLTVLSTLSKWAVSNQQLAHEHKSDKTLWLFEKCHGVGIQTPMLLMAREGQFTKSEAAQALLSRKLQKCDILIDDFNPNLQDWHQSGGTAIKWLNNQNTAESWPGMCIDKDTYIDALPLITAIGRQLPNKPPKRSNLYPKPEKEKMIWDL